MKFSTRQDIEAPAHFVFAQLTDFQSIEKQALRRGIEVKRKDDSQVNGVGAAWEAKVPFRGKWRDLHAEISQYEAPEELVAQARSGGLDMTISMELVPLSPKRTRLIVGFDVRPKTISARILVQSVKFAKTSLQRRFDKRVLKLSGTIAERFETGVSA